MKILMALMALDIGGAETHVTELSKELARRGHEIIVVSAGGVFANELEKFGIRHITAPLNLRSAAKMLSSYSILKRVIKEEKPDIVHAHARIPALICHFIHLFNRSFKFVTTVHGRFDANGILKYLTRWGSKTLAVSDDLKTYLLQNYRVKEKNIYVSVNGIDTNRFSAAITPSPIIEEFGLLPDATRIVYVSRLDSDVCAAGTALLDIFDYLNENLENLELVIVGTGSEYENMCRRAEEINLRVGRRAVIMTGARTDVNLINRTATLCVGVSRAALECMAAEKPCILAGSFGYMGIFTGELLAPAINNNFTCRSFLAIDNDQFAGDILKICAMDDTERTQLGKYSRRIVKEYYSIEKMTDDNFKMYDDVLSAGRYDAALLGYYGFKNSGDDALLYTIINQLKEKKPDIHILVFSNTPEETSKIYGVDSINRFRMYKMRRVLRKTKLFIMGGGSLIQNGTSTKSLIYYLSCLKIARRSGAKTMLFANGIGPVTGKLNRARVKKTLNAVDLITLRDGESLSELAALGVENENIYVTADPVFSVDETDFHSADALLEQYGIDENTQFACISMRKWNDLPPDFEELAAKMADHLFEKHNLLPVFIPMQYPYDAGVSRSIVSKMKTRGIFIGSRLDIPTIFGIVKRSSCVVSVRLHLLIYAALMHVPFIGISYDPKVSGFHLSVDQPYFIDPRALAAGDFKAVVDECIANSESVSEALAEKCDELKNRAEVTAAMAVEMINS